MCILTHLIIHKNPLHLCTRFVPVSILHQRTLLAPKTSAPSVSIRGFCNQAAADHQWVSASILLFLPLTAQHAAKQPNIAFNPSFSIHTATLSPIIEEDCVCVCCIQIPQHSCKLSDWRGGAARVVNCESKTVNRIWSRKRSGAWCMDWRRLAKTH